jgi:hypothetical protein
MRSILIPVTVFAKMDVEEIGRQIIEEQIKLPVDNRLNYIKEKLASIPDNKCRQEVDSYIWIYLLTHQAPYPKIVIALIHGIRTCATWQELVRYQLDQCKSTITYPIGYGYYDAFRFWCPFFTRKQPIDRILNELRGIQMKHRNDKVCVIAHSFGTYIISQILLDQSDVQFDRLLLCGSVIPEDFRWDKIVNLPVDGVVNDCGSKDIWPVLAKCTSWGYGASGTFGFKTHKIHDRYHDLGHSDFFDENFIRSFWLPFLIEGKIAKSNWETKRPTPSFFLSLFSWLPVKSLLIICILLYIEYPLWWTYLEHMLL